MKRFLFCAFLSTSNLFAAPATNEVSIIFDQEPKLQGMTFERTALRPDAITVGTKPTDVWTVGQGSAPGMGWGRSLMLTFTDPRFQNGKMPVVDIEIVYKNNSNAPVVIKADTTAGPAQIGGDFGASTELKTLKLHLDKAFFGARKTNSNPMDSNPDGCDIRLTGFNEDMQIKSVRVLGGPVNSANRPEASIVFEKEPKEKGLTFNRTGLRPDTLSVATEKLPVWVAQQGSAPGMGWGRSVMFTITDPQFTQGKMPVVDIELVYKNNSNAPVLLKADTARGPVEIGSSFGVSNGLQTLKVRLDDAFFGQRKTNSDPMKAEPDGCDLRLTAFNNDIQIRSIRVTGHDLTNRPDFTRLLKLDSIVTEPDDIFLFSPEGKSVINFGLKNSARKPFAGRVAFTVRDGSEKVLSENKTEAQLEASARTSVPFSFDTQGLKNGIYYIDFQLWDKVSATSKPLLEKRISVGVASGAKLGKAKSGEFLYGLDVRLGGAYQNPLLLRWAAEMGVDILRHGFDAEDNFDEVAASLPIYDKAGLQVMFITGAPWNDNAAERDKTIEHRAAFLEKLSGSFKQIRFYELGNEPDLKFFYGGPIENYTADYEKLYDAVKRGNPDTVVTNGGLSFFAEGDARSRKFIETVNPAKIDAFAYHGHGPGVEAERSAFLRVQKATLKYGKSGKPFIETESGMAAKTLGQQRQQARTVIQKMVYAQSEKLPLFMWFRLIMFEEDYGSLNSDREPRGAVLAYRAMVETLRGYTFTQLIDTGKDGTEGYLFTQNNGPGRVCVLWSNQPAFHTAYLAAGSSSNQIHDSKVIDMYGNARAADLLANGVLRAPISEDPIFLKWETSEPDYLVQRAPSMIDLPPVAQLVFNSANPLALEIRNPSEAPLNATLDAKVQADVTAVLEPARQTIDLAPGEVKKIQLAVRLQSSKETIAWPEDWTVFVNIDDKAVDPATLSSAPQTLPGENGKTVRGTRVFPRNNQIDFAQLGGSARERAAAVVFTEIESETDRTVAVGTGADWWMQWFVNGKPVFDTLARGNEGATSVTAHRFNLPLRKGRNLLAVKILSGSGGWKFAVAGPDALQQAGKVQSSLDHIAFDLSANGKVIASEKLAIQYTPPLPALQGITLNDTVAKWEQRKPTVVFDEKAVHNLFDKAPDSTRWWQGANDLSGRAWLSFDTDRIYYVIKVLDDTHAPGVTADFDSLQLAISPGGLEDYSEYLVGVENNLPVITKLQARSGLPVGELPVENPEISATVERNEASDDSPAGTVYRISLDRKQVGSDSFFTNLLINDRDAEVRKQTLEWHPGMREAHLPKLWYRATLEK